MSRRASCCARRRVSASRAADAWPLQHPLTVAVRCIPLSCGRELCGQYVRTRPRRSAARRSLAERYGVTGGTTARDWVSDDLTERELTPYFAPAPEELETAGVNAVFLGHFVPWDPQRSLETAVAHGFEAAEAPRTGFYDYADIDDDFISVHHWFKWPKFGFTRTFDNLSLEIRNGRIGREEAIEVLRRRGDETRTPISTAGVRSSVSATTASTRSSSAPPAVWTRRDGAWDRALVPGCWR